MINDHPIDAAALDARAALYALLSRLYTYPLDAAALGQVAGLQVEGEARVPHDALSRRAGAKHTGPPSPGKALAKMRHALGDAADVRATVEELNTEATRLFEGPGRPAAPPYASFYLNDGRLMGPEAIRVRKAYLAERLLPNDAHVPPDHLLIELGFMATLARLALDTKVEEPLLASRRFLSEHILTWLPYWHSDLRNAEPHPFFEGLGDFTLAVLEQDLEWLDDALGLDESRIASGLYDPNNLRQSGLVPAPASNGALEEVK